jgi:SAM-dependent methyltransferase
MEDLTTGVAGYVMATPHRHDDLFAAMRETEMNNWVGGSDPKLVGIFNDAFLSRMLTIGADSDVLDFGCGIGRVATAVLGRDARPASLVGIDIVPELVDFCRREITPRCPNTAFELVAGANDHYDRFIDAAIPAQTREGLIAQYGGRFTHAYAISVFTHLDVDHFTEELAFVQALLADRAEFLFTAFTLTPFSRRMIAAKRAEFPFTDNEYRDGGRIFVGDRTDPLSFIAYDRSLIDEFADSAGLVITKVEYGTWMGGSIGNTLQDLYVCRKVA